MEDEALALRDLMQGRTYIYTLFHKLFGGTPTEELLDILGDDETLARFEVLGEESAAFRNFVVLLRAFNEQDRDELLDHAVGEYTRMFIGPGMPEALPWESPYLSKEPTFFQENTLFVRRAYGKLGLQAKMLGHVPDDHVSIMCAFLAELARRADSAFDRGDITALDFLLRSSQDFVVNHLMTWLPSYAQSARKAKTAYIYPQLIEALSEFAEMDSVFLGEAAYWVEQLDAGTDLVMLIGSQGASRTEKEQESLEKLRAISLIGLEDNEVVEVS